jgi:hypothetical protein
MGSSCCQEGRVSAELQRSEADGSQCRFKTGYVLAEQPPLGQGEDGKDKTTEWYDLFGGEPDVVGSDLAEVAKKITEMTK